jgi:hypothetical protein
MFDSKENIAARLTDAADLLIDFATLGEYGLEPTGGPAPTCETRRRRSVSPATNRQRRLGAPTLVLANDGPFLLRP